MSKSEIEQKINRLLLDPMEHATEAERAAADAEIQALREILMLEISQEVGYTELR